MLDKLKSRMEQLTKAATETSLGLHPENWLVSDEIANSRYDICSQCEYLYKPTTSCKLCGCFMKVKTKLKIASCPIKKWTEESDQS